MGYIEGTTPEDELVTIATNFRGSYLEAREYVESVIEELGNEHGFIHIIEYTYRGTITD